MAEPRALDGMQSDERQELKEAVCDAILERTRRVVSGEGSHGAVILGEKPSRVLSSGFILPRLNEDGDDESSDIKIAAHGVDLRVRPAEGILRIRINLFVYVRALPGASELFARDGRLIPRADFNDGSRQLAKAQIGRRAADEIPQRVPTGERAARRAAISREVYIAMGVGVPPAARLPGGDDRDDIAVEDGVPPSSVLDGRLRIPDRLSRRYDIPQKWVRLPVEAPPLEVPLPCDPERWEVLVAEHKGRLQQSIRAAFMAWIESPAGQTDAWRSLHPPSEAFWDRDAWERYLVTARSVTPDAAGLVPDLDVQLLVQPLADPLDSGTYSVRVALENLREGGRESESGLFGVALTIELPNAALGPMRLERVRRSYHLAGFMTMPAIGVNGGVSDLGIADGQRVLRSSWMPRYVLPRSEATEIAAVPTAYGELALDATDLGRLRALPEAMREWTGRVTRETRLSAPGEEGSGADETAQQNRFQEDLDAWRSEMGRISSGVELLCRSQAAWRADANARAGAPYRAWLLLNRTFSAANPTREREPLPGWRLFQLAFVLAHVPTWVSRLPEYAEAFDAAYDEDSSSLLYMSTGVGRPRRFSVRSSSPSSWIGFAASAAA